MRVLFINLIVPSETGISCGVGQFVEQYVFESERGSNATIWSLKLASVRKAINSFGKSVQEDDGVLQRRVMTECSSSQLDGVFE